MAQRTQITYLDDIDGTEDARTYRFSWGSTQYEIDLSDANRDAFLAAIEPYTSAGRKVAGPRTPRQSSDSAAIRAWAKENGLEVPERGRIPEKVRAAYDAR